MRQRLQFYRSVTQALGELSGDIGQECLTDIRMIAKNSVKARFRQQIGLNVFVGNDVGESSFSSFEECHFSNRAAGSEARQPPA